MIKYLKLNTRLVSVITMLKRDICGLKLRIMQIFFKLQNLDTSYSYNLYTDTSQHPSVRRRISDTNNYIDTSNVFCLMKENWGIVILLLKILVCVRVTSLSVPSPINEAFRP
jgi:hypothetical protein